MILSTAAASLIHTSPVPSTYLHCELWGDDNCRIGVVVVQSSIIHSWMSKEAVLAEEHLPHQRTEAFLPFHFSPMVKIQ